ncbi:PqqD family protein [Calditrichota bacterium LG25]
MEDNVFFQLIPVRQFEWKIEEESQRVIILRPKYISKWAQKLTKPFTGESFFKIKLDALGSQVWQYCDGAHSVEEILHILQKKFPEEEDLDKRFVLFIKQLYREKFINLLQKVVEEDSTTHPE